jgi:hypothetical protein
MTVARHRMKESRIRKRLTQAENSTSGFTEAQIQVGFHPLAAARVGGHGATPDGSLSRRQTQSSPPQACLLCRLLHPCVPLRPPGLSPWHLSRVLLSPNKGLWVAFLLLP